MNAPRSRRLLPAFLVALTALALCAAGANNPAADVSPAERPADERAEQAAAAGEGKWVKLFAEEGEPKGWVVRVWFDVSQPGPEGAVWTVKDGVLHGSEPRGTWLVSEKDYGDFVLEYEFKLGERGNSGVGLRFPPRGDPAFDGLELQMADERYNEGRDGPDKLTGSLYKALAPKKQVYKPTEWNKYVITLKGPTVKVGLNGELIQDVNLDQQTKKVERHDGRPAPPLKDRPRKGRIGFQELSRGGAHVLIRNARIKELTGGADNAEGAAREPRQTVEAFLDAALNGKPQEAAALGEPGQSPGQEENVRKNFSELKVQKLPLTRLYADDGNALAVTAIVPAGKQAGPLVLTLVKREGRWMVRDIDMETPASSEEEVKRFQKRYPKAKLVLEKEAKKEGEGL